MYRRTYDIVYTGMFTVLLAICSWISLPTMIPFTLQTFGIFLILFVLGGKRGTTVILIYLLLGCIGIPVFSNFGAGVGYLLGNTGGFALGFLWIGLSLWLSEKLCPANPYIQIFASLIGLALCYLFGCFWFLQVSGSASTLPTFHSVLSICVLPFIVPDLCKLGMAYLFSKRLKPLLNLK